MSESRGELLVPALSLCSQFHCRRHRHMFCLVHSDLHLQTHSKQTKGPNNAHLVPKHTCVASLSWSYMNYTWAHEPKVLNNRFILFKMQKGALFTTAQLIKARLACYHRFQCATLTLVHTPPTWTTRAWPSVASCFTSVTPLSFLDSLRNFTSWKVTYYFTHWYFYFHQHLHIVLHNMVK